jgi:DNA-binding transcriptional ArsR family regulator
VAELVPSSQPGAGGQRDSGQRDSEPGDSEPGDGGPDDAAGPVFAAVASPARRQLLGLLREHGPLPVQDLAAHFAMRRPSVSEHLRVLKDAGLVSEHKAGRKRYYRLEPRPLREVSRWLSPYEQFGREKLSGLHELPDSELLGSEPEDGGRDDGGSCDRAHDGAGAD